MERALDNVIDKIYSTIPHRLWQVLALIGITNTIASISAILYKWRRIYWTQYDLPSRYGKNTWVMITGAANGIGRAFAIEFAKLGFNIVGLDIDEIGLAHLKEDIQTAVNPKIEVKTINVDFTQVANEDFFDKIEAQTNLLDISILVNNVGIGKASNFEKKSLTEIRNVLLVNNITTVLMTHKFLRRLLARTAKPDIKSAVITMSSLVALHPAKFWNVYASTKLFNYAFSKALSEEYGDKIDFLAVKCGTVSTQMTKYIVDLTVVDPLCHVRGDLLALGHSKETCGHWLHEIFSTFAVSRTLQDFFYNENRIHQETLQNAKK